MIMIIALGAAMIFGKMTREVKDLNISQTLMEITLQNEKLRKKVKI
jgi:hypothetical protein